MYYFETKWWKYVIIFMIFLYANKATAPTHFFEYHLYTSYKIISQDNTSIIKHDTYKQTSENNFILKLEKIAKELGVNSIDLFRIIYFETKGTLDPSIVNSIGAVGLIQFMPQTAAYLGTTTKKLVRMSAIEQLDWVLKYYKKVARLPKNSSISDIYLATFLPLALHLKLPDEHIIAVNPNSTNPELSKMAETPIINNIDNITKGKLWESNPIFIQSNKDYFTIGDIRDTIEEMTDDKMINNLYYLDLKYAKNK